MLHTVPFSGGHNCDRVFHQFAKVKGSLVRVPSKTIEAEFSLHLKPEM